MQAGVYRHYRGGYYQVLGVAEHSNTKELMVVYVSLSGAHLPGPRMRVRPLAEFIENDLEIDDPDGSGRIWTSRYKYVGDEIPQPSLPQKLIDSQHVEMLNRLMGTKISE